MNLLNLSPLPCLRLPEDSRAPTTSEYHPGFVDDAVVLALVSAPVVSPFTGADTGLALAADELDFAGWHPASCLW